MKESRLTYLFQVYFNKTATSNERSEFMELLAQAENDKQIKTLLTETWQQFNSQSQLFNDSQGEEMLASILHKGRAYKPIEVIMAYKRPFNWLRTAAAAAMLFFAVTGVYLWLKPKQPRQQIVQSKKVPKEVNDAIVPGGNKAVLTLSDGSSIVLDSTQQGTLAKQGNVKVMKLNSATLAYNSGNENNQAIVYNTLSRNNLNSARKTLPFLKDR